MNTKVPRKSACPQPPSAPAVIVQMVTDSLLVAQAAAPLENGDLHMFNTNPAVPQPKLTLLQPHLNPNNVKKNVMKKRQIRLINHNIDL